jgi:hypothetical protein
MESIAMFICSLCFSSAFVVFEKYALGALWYFTHFYQSKVIFLMKEMLFDNFQVGELFQVGPDLPFVDPRVACGLLCI